MTSDPFKRREDKPQPKQPLVLTKIELDRLISNSQSNQNEKEEDSARDEEREKRQEATKALSKLIAQRKKPGSELRKQQYEKAVQIARDELMRDDRIETRRNYVLDLAYKRLFEETDRVKHFKTAKNLSEMLKQRNMQTAAKAGMQDQSSKYEKEFVLGMLRDIESHQREDVEKAEKIKKDKIKNAENWTKQRAEVEKKKKQEEWEHLRDGYTVREAAANYAEEVKNAELEQKKKLVKYKTELDKQRDQKQTLLDMYSQLDEADDKRAKIFNDAKRNMKIKHQEVKKELDGKKESKRQHVAENLKDESKALKAKEEAILRKATLQAEAKQREECAIKQADKEEALKAIQEFYDNEMKAKTKREFEERRQGFRERRKILENTDEQMQVEDAKKMAKKNMEKESQHLQLHQIAKRKMDRNEEKLDEMKDYMNHMRSLDDEEEMFQKYAQIEIAECAARGINTRPMQVAARPGIECGKGPLFKYRGHIRPKYYSALSGGDELSHVKRGQNQSDSKSRLGFMLH